MKNKITRTIVFLIIPFVTFAAAGFADRYYEFRHWMYPAYLYNLIFGIGFLAVTAILYYNFREKLNPKISRLCQYLKTHPTLAIIYCGIPVGIVMGWALRFAWLTDMRSLSTFLKALLLLTAILFSYRSFRVKALLTSIVFKVLSIFLVSILCASLFFSFSVLSGVIQMSDTLPYSENLHNRVLLIFYDGLYGMWVVVSYGITLLWIGKACRWLHNKLVALPIIPITYTHNEKYSKGSN